ncbi:MAG: RNA 2',3'-cyclic phosphodiesterase [Patescibacteria group bacterium]|nr:RNA 2',3'-cyclic phosphodiesterase [Patescibacteria group bacterium]
MLHRIFIAINLPEDIKEKLFNFSNKYSHLPARWVKKENIHITLSFLGNLDDNQLLETIETVKSLAVRHSSILIKLNKICYGPDKKFPPRMVWAKGEDNNALSRLHTDLEDTFFKLPSYKYKIKEDRPFSLHVTLARIKSFEFRKLAENIEINEDLNLSFEVNAIQVIESQLKKTGPEYTLLESVSLN